MTSAPVPVMGAPMANYAAAKRVGDFVFMSGVVVVESVFGWPGIGQLAWQAIQRVDIPIIMGVTLVSACGIVIGNLIADLISPLIDPRIKLR